MQIETEKSIDAVSAGSNIAPPKRLCFNAATKPAWRVMKEQTAYLGFGSNLGDSLATLRQARQALHAEPQIRVTAGSHLYRTAPIGGPADQPDYLNGVLEIETTLEPLDLLHCCQSIELKFGRRRATRWGSRTLDIDLLLYAEQVIDSATLKIPHPRMLERRFVLQPLCDLIADRRHPEQHCTFASLLIKISPTQGVHRLNEVW
jgi:2-amino-4-hydroxy-6-hydroxymethyldihydropteridine diphosphokinase